MIWVAMLPSVSLTIISANSTKTHSRAFKQRWGPLVEGVTKRHGGTYAQFYVPLFLFHRLLLCTIVIFFYNWPLAQLIVAFVLTVMMFFYLLIYRPIRSNVLFAFALLDEIFIAVCVLLLGAILATDHRSASGLTTSKWLGWATIGVVLFSALMHYFYAF